MSRIFRSVRSVLELPLFYQSWWNAVGGPGYAKALVREYVLREASNRILEIGCGPGTILPYLRLRPSDSYVGFDMNVRYIQRARSRFPQAQFVSARVSQYTLTEHKSFDTVLAFGIVHHLDDDEATQLFQIAHDALKSGGKLVTVDGVRTTGQSAARRWLLTRDRGDYVRNEAGYVNIASQVFTTVRSSIRSDLIRIPYTHLILECIRS
jgi:SAM-dependent methyltransferase